MRVDFYQLAGAPSDEVVASLAANLGLWMALFSGAVVVGGIGLLFLAQLELQEVELALARVQVGLTRLHDAEHLTFRSDHAHFGNADSLVDSGTGKDTLSRIEVGLIDGRNLRQEGSTLHEKVRSIADYPRLSRLASR